MYKKKNRLVGPAGRSHLAGGTLWMQVYKVPIITFLLQTAPFPPSSPNSSFKASTLSMSSLSQVFISLNCTLLVLFLN